MPINIERLREMRTVTMPNGDRFRFLWIEPSTLVQVIKLRDQRLEDREYIAQALNLLIEDPHPALEKLESLATEELADLVSRYLNLDVIWHERGRKEQEPLSPTSISEAHRELDEYIDEEVKRAEESSKEVMSSVSKIAKNLGGFQDSFKISPMWSYLDSVNSLANFHNQIAKQFRNPLLDYPSPLLDSIQIYNRSLADSWLSTQSNLTSMFSHIFDVGESFRDSLAATTRALAAIDLPSVIQGWQLALDQDLVEWAEEIREEYRAAYLVEANLQFLSDMSDQAIADIVDDAMEAPERQQASYITRRLFTHTSQPEFLESVLQEVETSARAQRRSQIFKAVHAAHGNRQFLLSIPTLLAQVEGLTIQLLAEMGIVRWDRRKKKWYEVDPETGKYLTRPVYKKGQDTGKRERILVKGLGDLSKFIPKLTQNPLPNTLPHMRDDMPQFRNLVMHGTTTNYGSSRRSSMLLLMAQIVSQQLRVLEQSGQQV